MQIQWQIDAIFYNLSKSNSLRAWAPYSNKTHHLVSSSSSKVDGLKGTWYSSTIISSFMNSILSVIIGYLYYRCYVSHPFQLQWPQVFDQVTIVRQNKINPTEIHNISQNKQASFAKYKFVSQKILKRNLTHKNLK
jgi:hypothetical protein